MLIADQINVPSLTMARHSVADEHETEITVSAAVGVATGFHVAPALVVATTTPLPGSDAPLDPTATQSFGVGHETPFSSGMLPPATC